MLTDHGLIHASLQDQDGQDNRKTRAWEMNTQSPYYKYSKQKHNDQPTTTA